MLNLARMIRVNVWPAKFSNRYFSLFCIAYQIKYKHNDDKNFANFF